MNYELGIRNHKSFFVLFNFIKDGNILILLSQNLIHNS